MSRKCNLCGKEFDTYDEAQDFSICHNVGYGSAHDCERIRIDLCCECLDKFIDGMAAACKIDPVCGEYM